MASDELNVVLNMLKSNPPVGEDADILTLREGLEAMVGSFPPPKDITYTPTRAGGIPAEWAEAGDIEPDRALLYFHGGGYTIGSIATHRNLAGAISRASRTRVLSLNYRLAPEDPFPAAVDDAIAAYEALLASGFPPERLALAGDSAGGGLTAACLVALREREIPRPAAAVCISPWLDLSFSGESMVTLADIDPLVTKDGLQMMADAYLGDTDPREPLASPVFAELQDLPPILIQVGSAETLLDDSTRFAERAQVAGVHVELEVWQDMIHVWQSFSAILPEARDAVEGIGKFLRSHLD